MPVYSHSMISTYETCPLQFKLRYIERVEVEIKESVEAFLGLRVHETLAKLHEDLILSKLTPIDELLGYYNSVWKKNWNQNILISREGFTEENYYDTGERAIRDYYKHYQPFTGIRTIATEKPLFFKLKNEYNFRGYLDRLDIKDGEIYEIHDYKTSRNLPDDEILANDRQLALYSIGIKQHYRDAEKVRLIWHYLIFDKEFTVEKTEEELKEIEERTVELIKTIETDTEFKPVENNLCGWCDYPEYCPVQKHIVKTEALPVEEFLKDNGVDLANRYVDLKAKINVLEKELDVLKEKIIAYAHKEGFTQLRGSNHILRINERDVLKFPSSGDPERAELEELIKEVGKWEEVSTLDLSSLKRILSKSAWDKEILNKIQSFTTPDKEIRITVRNIKEEDE